MRAEAANTGEELPKRIQNAPILRLGSALYLNAWFDLDLERDRSKLDPIKRSSCFEFASDYELSWEQTEDLWFYISKMDREFLKWYKTKLPKQGSGKAERVTRRGRTE